MFEHLQKAVELAVKREGPKFAEKHAKYGFWSNPFSDYNYPMTTNFEKLFVGRKEEIEEISNCLVESFLGKGEDTAVIAPCGFGNRSVINLFKLFIHSLEKEDISKAHQKIKEMLFDIVDYDPSDMNMDLLKETKQKIEESIKNKKMIVITSSFNPKVSFIPDSDKMSECPTERFRQFLALDIRSKEKTVFLSPWNASIWLYMMEEHPISISIYENKKILTSLSEEKIVELLKLRMNDCEHNSGMKRILFNDKVLKEIAKFSGGIPRFALEFAYYLLEDAIKAEKDTPLTDKFIQSALNQRGFYQYDDIKQKLKKLIPDPKPWQKKPRTEKIIIETMIHLSGKDVTSTEIGKRIGKSRVAVLTNLKKLEKENLIEREKEESKDSRRRPYKINDFVRSVFENEFIIPEIRKRLKESK